MRKTKEVSDGKKQKAIPLRIAICDHRDDNYVAGSRICWQRRRRNDQSPKGRRRYNWHNGHRWIYLHKKGGRDSQ